VRAGAGKGPALVSFILLTALLSGAAARAAESAALPLLPVEASGRIRFHVDGAIYATAAGNREVAFDLSIPQAEVSCVALEGRDGRHMDLAVCILFLDDEGRERVHLADTLLVPCQPEDESIGVTRQRVHLRAPLSFGATSFEVQLTDRRPRDLGLLHRLAGVKKRGEARGRLEPLELEGGWGISRPIFLWEVGAARGLRTAGGFLIGPADSLRHALSAHPPRSFGLQQPSMAFYFEIYGGQQRPVYLNVEVRAAVDGALLHERRARVEPAWDRCGVIKKFDISQLVAGTYALIIEAWPESQAGSPDTTGRPSRAQGNFQISWDPEAWRRTPVERREEASLLLDGGAWEQFLSLQAGPQEAFLDSLWAGVADRTGYGNQDDLKQEFYRRVELADARYSGLKRGSLTDRGRVFVHFGDPDEVHKQLHPTDKEEILHVFLREEIDQTEAEMMGGRPPQHPMDTSAYEVWYYVYRGDPLFEQWYPTGYGQSLRFIFVDKLGSGDYQLIYTNLFGGFK
jgi:GWxTD domain-containing protein